MNYRTDTDVARLANSIGVEQRALAAVLMVETQGSGFGPMGPTIRWEGHYFDRLVKAELREKARSLGLASPKVGGVKNPSSQEKRYEILNRAAELDEEAAYSSISIGLGQVMGSHAKSLGFSTAKEMFSYCSLSLINQIDVMCRFIDKNGLVDELQRKDWSAFARGYNGPQYRTNQYDTKLAAAYGRENAPVTSGMLRLGSEGAEVRELQQKLVRAGYAVTVDGDFGPATKQAVEAFQRANGFKVDGVVGPQTQAKLVELGPVAPQKLMEINGVRAGAAIAAVGAVLPQVVDALNTTAQQLGPLAGVLPFVHTVTTTLTVLAALGGLAIALQGIWKSRSTHKGLA